MRPKRVQPLSEWQVNQRIQRWLEWSAAPGTSSVYRGGVGGGGSSAGPSEGLARACDVGMAISRCPPVTLRGGQRVPAVEVVARLRVKLAWAGRLELSDELAERVKSWRDAVRAVSRSWQYTGGIAYLAQRWAESDLIDRDSSRFWAALNRACDPAERLRDLVDRWSLPYRTIVRLLDNDGVTDSVVRNWLRSPDSPSHTPPPYGFVLQLECMLDGVLEDEGNLEDGAQSPGPEGDNNGPGIQGAKRLD